MDRLTAKCSTIMIATRGKTRVYQSVEEVPEELRKQLLATTRGINSATILIADKGGRREILDAVRSNSPDRYAELAGYLAEEESNPALPGSRWRIVLPLAGRVLLVGCLGDVLWVLASLR